MIEKNKPVLKQIFSTLETLRIRYSYFESPADFVDEDDANFWMKTGAIRCKNLFLRNHKGDRHFLVIAPFYEPVSIYNLEQHFKKGKISFASDQRLQRVLKVVPGAVSVFGLLNDPAHKTEVFLDDRLQQEALLSFLPNYKGAIITLAYTDVIRFLEHTGHRHTVFNLKPCS